MLSVTLNTFYNNICYIFKHIKTTAPVHLNHKLTKRMKNSLLLIFLLLVSDRTFSQHAVTVQDLEKKLTNSSSKQWILKGTNTFLGDTCTNGIKLSFTLSNKIVEKKGCISGHTRSILYTWKIAAPSSDEVVPRLNFTDAQNKLAETYKMQFVTKDGEKYLRLRLSKGTKISETEDFYFQ
jgi:hypothetical protein